MCVCVSVVACMECKVCTRVRVRVFCMYAYHIAKTLAPLCVRVCVCMYDYHIVASIKTFAPFESVCTCGCACVCVSLPYFLAFNLYHRRICVFVFRIFL